MPRAIYYLASPYHHERAAVTKARHRETVLATAGLMAAGTSVFSPIVHNHPIMRTGLVATNPEYAARWRFWRVYDYAMLARCDGLLILTLPGWEKSLGVAAERRRARRLGKPIGYVEPRTLKIRWD